MPLSDWAVTVLSFFFLFVSFIECCVVCWYFRFDRTVFIHRKCTWSKVVRPLPSFEFGFGFGFELDYRVDVCFGFQSLILAMAMATVTAWLRLCLKIPRETVFRKNSQWNARLRLLQKKKLITFFLLSARRNMRNKDKKNVVNLVSI